MARGARRTCPGPHRWSRADGRPAGAALRQRHAQLTTSTQRRRGAAQMDRRPDPAAPRVGWAGWAAGGLESAAPRRRLAGEGGGRLGTLLGPRRSVGPGDRTGGAGCCRDNITQLTRNCGGEPPGPDRTCQARGWAGGGRSRRDGAPGHLN